MREGKTLRWTCPSCNHFNETVDAFQCAGCGIDWLADDAPEPESDDDDIEEDCGMLSDEQCTKAGSEFCDWDCPRNRPVRRPLPPALATDDGERADG